MATMTVATLLVALGALAALSGTCAKNLTVGGTTMWTVMPTFNYTQWAENASAEVGDILFFKYSPEAHDVRSVTVTQYDSCDTQNFLQLWASGEDSVVLNTPGTWYFLCSFQQHCSNGGQKFSIEVSAASESAGSPPDSPNSPTKTSPPPPPSSAHLLLPPFAGLLALDILVLISTRML